MMRFGLDRLLDERALRKPLEGRRLALLAHPASVTADLTHALDAIAGIGGLRLAAAFGPQHGLRGDKQDNMVESPEFTDPRLGIPVHSLYGKVRRPTAEMMPALMDGGCSTIGLSVRPRASDHIPTSVSFLGNASGTTRPFISTLSSVIMRD